MRAHDVERVLLTAFEVVFVVIQDLATGIAAIAEQRDVNVCVSSGATDVAGERVNDVSVHCN